MSSKWIRIFSLLIVTFPMLFYAVEVNAMNTGFQTESITNDNQETFTSYANFSLILEEPVKSGITCFDVNEKEILAVGQGSGEAKTVCIYSSDGIFMYGYTFQCTGNFAVEWDNDKLNIYFVRSDIIASLTEDGTIVDVKRVQDTIPNNSYRNDLLYTTRQVVGGNTYLIKNDMGILNVIATSYSQVVRIHSNGTTKIIYDINSTQLANTWTVLIVVFIFACSAIAIIAWRFIKPR